ncbi:MAG TPA: hypothetical protein VFS44_12575 [Gemmatimonadaceae bacterium]|nr:hypothetical protein [Gemmatimonadaceae bacterium]
MRGKLILALTSAGLLFSGCGDAMAPYGIVGRYTYSGFIPSEQAYDGTPPQPPLPGVQYMLDSLADTVVLSLGGAYRENGVVAAHSLAGPELITPFQAHGTYVVHGSSITLTPVDSLNVSGGTGVVGGDSLTVSRYPGAWVFSKQ